MLEDVIIALFVGERERESERSLTCCLRVSCHENTLRRVFTRVCWEFLSGCLLSSARDFVSPSLLPCLPPFVETEAAVLLFVVFFFSTWLSCNVYSSATEFTSHSRKVLKQTLITV